MVATVPDLADSYCVEQLGELELGNDPWENSLLLPSRPPDNLSLPIPQHISISQDGKSAKGQWLLFQPCTDAKAGAAWLAATYYDTYEKQPSGEWLIAETIIDVAFFAPLDQGWVKQRFLPGREPERFKDGDWSKL